MQTVAYISCPNIASEHLQDYLTELFRPSQWAVIYPSFDQPTSDVASFEEFKRVIEDEYEEYLLEPAFDADYAELMADPDHRIHRPDDDLADLTQAEEDELVHGMEDEDAEYEDEDEPACGDCGGCSECVGDPEDCRYDTLAERIDAEG